MGNTSGATARMDRTSGVTPWRRCRSLMRFNGPRFARPLRLHLVGGGVADCHLVSSSAIVTLVVAGNAAADHLGLGEPVEREHRLAQPSPLDVFDEVVDDFAEQWALAEAMFVHVSRD